MVKKFHYVKPTLWQLGPSTDKMQCADGSTASVDQTCDSGGNVDTTSSCSTGYAPYASDTDEWNITHCGNGYAAGFSCGTGSGVGTACGVGGNVT